MLDYCLMTCFFANDIETYNFVGDFFEIHPIVTQVIQAKKISQSDDAELVYIHNESYQFINFWINNYLQPELKWLLISVKDKEYEKILFKEIRFYAEDALLIDDLIILKNIKNNFSEFKRKDFNIPILEKNIEEFFNLEIDKHNDTVNIIDNKDSAYIIKILNSSSDFVYFGDCSFITTHIDKLKQLCHMNLKVLECRTFDNELLGYFCKKDFIKNLLIYLGSSSDSLYQYFKLHIHKLIIPIARI